MEASKGRTKIDGADFSVPLNIFSRATNVANVGTQESWKGYVIKLDKTNIWELYLYRFGPNLSDFVPDGTVIVIQLIKRK